MDNKLIVNFCKQLGCCNSCCLRYIGLKSPSAYENSEEYVLKYLDSPVSNGSTAQQPNNESEEPASKRQKSNICVTCLGILQKEHWADTVAMVKEMFDKKDYQCNNFAVALSAPICTILREKAATLFICDKYPVYDEGILTPLKEAWKWSFGVHLTSKLNRTLDSGKYALLLVTVNMEYIDDLQELEVVKTLAPEHYNSRSRQRRRFAVEFTRRSVETALSDVKLEALSKIEGYTAGLPDVKFSAKCVSVIGNHEPIYLGGRYIKLSRELPQTPWLVRGKKVMDSSVQDVIFGPIAMICGMSSEDAEYRLKLMSAGREDVDVRCLGDGRPFAVEITDPRRELTTEELQRICEEINKDGRVVVKQLLTVTKDDLIQLKKGEETKCKTYDAICMKLRPIDGSMPYNFAPSAVTQRDIDSINTFAPVTLSQKTPLRVLHRRPLLTRTRTIYELKAELVPDHPSLIKIRLKTEAGTYVKEFVHGECGRTKPCLADALKPRTSKADVVKQNGGENGSDKNCDDGAVNQEVEAIDGSANGDKNDDQLTRFDILALDVDSIHLEWPVVREYNPEDLPYLDKRPMREQWESDRQWHPHPFFISKRSDRHRREGCGSNLGECLGVFRMTSKSSMFGGLGSGYSVHTYLFEFAKLFLYFMNFILDFITCVIQIFIRSVMGIFVLIQGVIGDIVRGIYNMFAFCLQVLTIIPCLMFYACFSTMRRLLCHCNCLYEKIQLLLVSIVLFVFIIWFLNATELLDVLLKPFDYVRMKPPKEVLKEAPQYLIRPKLYSITPSYDDDLKFLQQPMTEIPTRNFSAVNAEFEYPDTPEEATILSQSIAVEITETATAPGYNEESKMVNPNLIDIPIYDTLIENEITQETMDGKGKVTQYKKGGKLQTVTEMHMESISEVEIEPIRPIGEGEATEKAPKTAFYTILVPKFVHTEPKPAEKSDLYTMFLPKYVRPELNTPTETVFSMTGKPTLEAEPEEKLETMLIYYPTNAENEGGRHAQHSIVDPNLGGRTGVDLITYKQFGNAEDTTKTYSEQTSLRDIKNTERGYATVIYSEGTKQNIELKANEKDLEPVTYFDTSEPTFVSLSTDKPSTSSEKTNTYMERERHTESHDTSQTGHFNLDTNTPATEIHLEPITYGDTEITLLPKSRLEDADQFSTERRFVPYGTQEIPILQESTDTALIDIFTGDITSVTENTMFVNKDTDTIGIVTEETIANKDTDTIGIVTEETITEDKGVGDTAAIEILTEETKVEDRVSASVEVVTEDTENTRSASVEVVTEDTENTSAGDSSSRPDEIVILEDTTLKPDAETLKTNSDISDIVYDFTKEPTEQIFTDLVEQLKSET